MPTPICVVDAFASEKFRGNPAAVCILKSQGDPEWMQKVAAEMNLSETAFLAPRPDGGWDLRWFTPTIEVALCGHATLASAHALWEQGLAPASESIRFHTKSGWLVCRRDGVDIAMDFPARPAESATPPSGLEAALGTRITWCGRSADDYLVEIADAKTVRDLRPNLAALAKFQVRGVIVTATSDESRFDFISRFFGPAAGVPEDPVTGSAHCTLAVYWSKKLGRTKLRGWQASARGGEVAVEIQDQRVTLSGTAVTVWRGELL